MVLFRQAFRSLLKTPGFTLVAILTLGLGIGANAGVFSFVNTLLLRPLPLPDVGALVFIGEHSEQVPNMSVSYPNFLDWHARQTSFSHLGLFRGQSFNYLGRSETERLRGAQLTHDLWPALGQAPLLGRWFGVDEDKPGAAPTAVISESLWRRVFGGAPTALGAKLTLSGELYTVVGVMPASFAFPAPQTDVWVPFGLVADQNQARDNHPGLYAVGRLRPGVTLEAARTDLKGIARQLEQQYPQTNAGNSVVLNPLVEQVVGQARASVWVSFAAACGVLLIACANVANLLLARASARAREFAIRAAIGATRAHLIRLVLAESLLLGLAGTALGLLVGSATMDGIKAIIPASSSFGPQVTMDRNVLLFAIVAGVGVTLLCGLVPAFLSSRVNLSSALAAGGRSGSAGVHVRWRSVLVAGEFALTCVLLFASGLMFRTIYNLYRADTGLQTDHIVSFSYAMPGADWSDGAKRLQLLDRALARLRTLPGVTSVALTNPLPLAGGGNQTFFLPEGAPEPGPGKLFTTENNAASGDYFATMHIPVVRGRAFSDTETTAMDGVCVVDTQFAATHFAGQDPLGKRIRFGPPGQFRYLTIIGVVGHVQNYGIGQDTRVQLYFSYRQSTPGFVSFVVRTARDPAALATEIRAAMREVEPTLPVFNLRTMAEVFDGTVVGQRVMLTLLAVFGALALLLAAIGLYGVLSFIVSQRTREVGIRLALGAPVTSVRQLMLGQGLRLAALGFGVGVVLCFVVSRVLGSVLYEVPPFDPLSLGLVTVLLLAIGLLASWLPARRATKVDPMVALRSE